MKIQYTAPGIQVFESALFKTTSTLLETPDLLLVVDPNWLPDEVTFIRRQAEEIQAGRPLWLLFTHSDYDHILGYGAFEGAKTMASEAFARQTDPVAALAAVKKWDEEYYIERNYPVVYPLIDVAAGKNGQEFTLGNTRFTFYLAPGHNSDGLFTVVSWNDQRVWIAGDYLSDVEFPFIYHSSEDYRQTLGIANDVMTKHRPTLLVPGHGSVTDSLAEMQKRRADSMDYLHHLWQSVRESTPFPEEDLWQRYHFRKGQESFHRNNETLVRKELTESGAIIPSVPE